VTVIHIQLDEEALEKAQAIAKAQGRSLEQFVAEWIRGLKGPEATGDPFAGWLADEPALADAVEAEAMRMRQERRAR
jgi:hypothetical protein